jgi:2-haloacid dehalogenase
MAVRPEVVLFDVNETLSNMESLRSRFLEVGSPGHLLETWFAATLRDGFALAAAGAYGEFAVIAAECLRTLLGAADGLTRDLDQAVDFVLAGLPELHVHPDVPDGMRMLHDAGIRLATLTNGSVALSETMLARAGVLDLLERRMSVGEVKRWKPAADPYRYAASQCGVAASRAALVAVHPWDTDGASRAGLTAAWINRRGGSYPRHFTPADVEGPDLPRVADALLALGE